MLLHQITTPWSDFQHKHVTIVKTHTLLKDIFAQNTKCINNFSITNLHFKGFGTKVQTGVSNSFDLYQGYIAGADNDSNVDSVLPILLEEPDNCVVYPNEIKLGYRST